VATYQGFLLPPPLVGVRTFRSAAPGDKCRVWVRLFSMSGAPVVGQVVSFANLWANPRLALLGGKAMLSGMRDSMETNADGFAEIALLRGVEVQVTVTSTGFSRKVTIPDAPEADLMDLISLAPDQFEVARISPVDEPRFS